MKKFSHLLWVLTPFWVFFFIYWTLGLHPNYLVNPVDIRGIYELERTLFGITEGGVKMIPGEWFGLHNCAMLDFVAGFSYLCWLPVPIGYCIWLFWKGRRRQSVDFGLAFLVVNLIGFIGYYVYPAAAPWYPLQHGFDVDPSTPGSAAGMARFDAVVGLPIFHAFYDKNANVFAAMPSLHAAYILVATIYVFRNRESWWMRLCFSLICLGTWFGAVYTAHHYVLDVLAGIAITFFGVYLYEGWRAKGEPEPEDGAMVTAKKAGHSDEKARAVRCPNAWDKVLCTALGAGYSPFGPGTMGALVATLIWVLGATMMRMELLQVVTFFCILIFTLISIRPIDRLETVWGADPSRVVVDEVVGVWICLLAVPGEAFSARWWIYVALAFGLFRLFDILKPLGIRKAEQLPGGWGVMMDDVLAGVAGLVVMVALGMVF